MDRVTFDRCVRALAAPGGRRALLRGLVGALLAGRGLSDADVIEARRPAKDARHRGNGISLERKRKKRKKKRKRPLVCTPQCAGKACGPNGCGGDCGTCSRMTVCAASGQCVGCVQAADCAALTCQVATCAAAACQYSAAQDGSGCAGGGICCGGSCIDAQRDANHCGGCGNTCSADRDCVDGQCVLRCDVCASGCPFRSVQAAIAAAAPEATISLCPGTYFEQLTISRNLTLVGLGDDPTQTILRIATAPIIRIDSGATVTIRNLTVTGASSGQEAAIRNIGILHLTAVHVRDNVTSVRDSSLGGGILNAGSAQLTLTDCEIAANTGFSGGGIYSSVGATTTLIRTVVEMNQAFTGGGILSSRGTVRLQDNSRVRSNGASGGLNFGGGIFNDGGTVSIATGSTVLNNTNGNCINSAGGVGCP